MRNFGRALRLALREWWTFAAAVVCACLVGLFWGGNIGTIYPFVEVAFQQRTIHEALEQKLRAAQQSVIELQQQIKEVESQHPEPDPEASGLLRVLKARLAAEKRAVDFYRRILPLVYKFVPNDRFAVISWLIVILLVGTVLKGMFIVAHNILAARFAEKGALRLREVLFRKALDLDIMAFRQTGGSDLMSRFTHDMGALSSGLEYLAGRLIREPIKMAACLLGAALISWRLLLLSLLLVPPALLLIRWLALMLRRANRRAMEKMAELYANLNEAFAGIALVKAFTMEGYEQRRFNDTSRQYYQNAMRIARYTAVVHPTTEILGMGTIGLALLAGAWLVVGGQTTLLGIPITNRPLDVASLALFYGLLAGAADPLRKLSDAFSRLQRAAAAADRIYAVIDRQPQISNPRHPRRVGRHKHSIVFDRVCFEYAPGKPVLTDFCLEVPFGQTVALVGPSGAGKSTVLALLCRFIDPTKGRVLLDGMPLQEISLRELRSQIGLVTQEPILFNDTVFNNIRYGSPGASEAAVVAAAKRAFAHQFIQRDLPDGYQTIVGPMGGRLSGGQRQRIALARAMLRDPAILLLDEPTSQVDVESERLICRALQEFVKGRTAFIVTHRPALIELADRVVVMDGGRVVASGTHGHLASCSPFFRQLSGQADGIRQAG